MSKMQPLQLEKTIATIEQFSPRYRAIASIGIGTGCRISEILPLKRADLIDKDNQLKKVVAFKKLKSKTTKKRELVIPQKLIPYVVEWLNLQAQNGYSFDDDFVFAGKCNKIMNRHSCYNYFYKALGRGFGTHFMRKSFAHNLFDLYKKRYPNDELKALELVRQALGHKFIDTTILYLNIRQDDLHYSQNAVFEGI